MLSKCCSDSMLLLCRKCSLSCSWPSLPRCDTAARVMAQSTLSAHDPEVARKVQVTRSWFLSIPLSWLPYWVWRSKGKLLRHSRSEFTLLSTDFNITSLPSSKTIRLESIKRAECSYRSGSRLAQNWAAVRCMEA